MDRTQHIFKSLDQFLPAGWMGDEERLRKFRMIIASCLAVILLCIGNGIFYGLVGHWIATVTCFFGILGAITCIVILRRTGNSVLAGNFFATCSYLFFAALTLSSYGIETLIVVWLLMAPLAGTLMVGVRSGKFWTGMTLLLFGLIAVLDMEDIALPATFDRKYIPWVNFVAFSGFLLFGAISIIGNEQVKLITLRKLRESRSQLLGSKLELESINAAIVTANKDLEEKVRERTKGLELSKQELDTFFYESSHALRRPVVRLMGLGQVMRIPHSPQERESFLQAIDTTTADMDQMLGDLLEVSELNAMQVQKRDIHLAAFLVHLSESMQAKGLDLVCEVEGEEAILADGFLLGLALRKILDNSIAYKKDSQDKAVVRIYGHRESDGWRLEVRDEGKGIHPDGLPEVTKMFAKATEHSRGSGLGLYIAEKAVNRMEGELEVDSVEGEWTQVTIRLKG